MTTMNKIKCLALSLALIVTTIGCMKEVSTMPHRIWPPPPNPPRIKLTNSYVGAVDFQETAFIKGVVLGEANEGTLYKPMAITVDREDRIAVTDTAWGKVWVFDRQNKSFFQLLRRGGFGKPVGITSDAQGNFYVADSIMGTVYVFNRNGAYLKEIKDIGLTRPAGLAADTINDLLYISDVRTHVIQVLQLSTHKLLRTIGKGRGAGIEYFNFPSNLFVDKKGKLYVSDTMNARVQIFDKKGRFLLTFGEFGDTAGKFARPKGIAVDSEGHIYVIDAAFNNIQIFDDEGTILMAFAGYGKTQGQMILPAGLTIDKDDYIYAVDSWNARFTIYEYLGDKHKERQKKGIKLIK